MWQDDSIHDSVHACNLVTMSLLLSQGALPAQAAAAAPAKGQQPAFKDCRIQLSAEFCPCHELQRNHTAAASMKIASALAILPNFSCLTAL
jgi:hypothetical protein